MINILVLVFCLNGILFSFVAAQTQAKVRASARKKILVHMLSYACVKAIFTVENYCVCACPWVPSEKQAGFTNFFNYVLNVLTFLLLQSTYILKIINY